MTAMTATSTVIESRTTIANAPELARAAGTNPLDYLIGRGFVQDASDADGLRAAFAGGTVTAYVGFDPTASSLHAGHLMGIMALATLQRFGHRPIALGGGGTALVGDPTGRTTARAIITPETIADRLKNILSQFDRHLDFAGGRFGANPPALLLNNADWLVALRYIEFLRDVGRHFSVNEMLSAETYKQRLETTGLNFVEFNYRLVQAYDFLHLFRAEGCVLQLGGSDQWGNIVGGVELIRKADGGKAYALVWPLLTTAAGAKMGKSEGNAVWLDPAQTHSQAYYQYWINVADTDIAKLLRLYTFLPEERIAELTRVSGAALREAKRVLAYETTALTHGTDAADEADAAAQALYPSRAVSTSKALQVSGADQVTKSGTVQTSAVISLPTTDIPTADLVNMTVADLFVRAGLCKSRGEARRLAAQGGLTLNEERVDNVDVPVHLSNDDAILRVGKKRYQRVRVVEPPG